MRQINPLKLNRKSAFNKDMFYTLSHNNTELKELMLTYKNMKFDNDYLLAKSIIPTSKSNVLEKVLNNFQKHTNIPVLLPIQYVMSLISGYLLKHKTFINKGGQKLYTDIWCIVLAPSGASKTLSLKIIKESFGYNPDFSSGIESDAAYIQEMKAKNYEMLVRDEFGQHFKSIQNNTGPMAMMRDYYLKTYDGDKLERQLKKESIKVEDPHLSILGMTVDETFFKILTAESLTDGLAQRFNFTVAEKDQSKNIIDYLDIKMSDVKNGLDELFNEINNTPIHSQYELFDYDLSVEIIKAHFSGLFSKFNHIPESFIRRLYQATYKYALIYHFILAKHSDILDKEDINLACNYMSIHVKSLKRLLDEVGFQNIEEDVYLIDKAVQKLKSQNKNVDVNSVVRLLMMNHKTKFKDLSKTKMMVGCLLEI